VAEEIVELDSAVLIEVTNLLQTSEADILLGDVHYSFQTLPTRRVHIVSSNARVVSIVEL